MDTGFIQVASSFTCTPIEPALRRSLERSGVPTSLRFAMYAQMSQALLAPDAQAAGTVVLLRLEDWLRDTLKSESAGMPPQALREFLKARTDEFVQQSSALSQFGKPVWLLVCPSTGWLAAKHKLEPLCQTYTNLLGARIRSLSQVTSLPWPASLFHSDVQDRSADRLGQIPFTQEAFDRLGEFLGQQIAKVSAHNRQIASTTPKDGAAQLSAYLNSLQVQVSLVPALASDRDDIDRLLRSAATFSLTGEQRDLSDANIDELLNSGYCLLVKVSDRIADYGLTALVAFRMEPEKDVLSVHTMAVSCTVLGKQVEFALVSALTQLAINHGVAKILFEYRPSERNQPMLAFLQSLADSGSGTDYVLAVAASEARLQAVAAAPGAWTVKYVKEHFEEKLTESVH